MIELKSPSQIQKLREAGRVVAHALAAVRSVADVGITTRELDSIAAKVISDAGATPAFLDYHPAWAPVPFHGVICASVNDAIVHGVPDETRLADGDLVSIDCGAFLDGWCGDAAISFVVGRPDPVDLALIAATDAALRRGIDSAQPGKKLGDIAFAIGSAARAEGYGLLADHGGHGVGRAMHEDPHVANDGRPGRGFGLRPGLVIAIEPMLILGGSDDYVGGADGWTVRSANGRRAAHSEHTIAIMEDGPVVLTLP